MKILEGLTYVALLAAVTAVLLGHNGYAVGPAWAALALFYLWQRGGAAKTDARYASHKRADPLTYRSVSALRAIAMSYPQFPYEPDETIHESSSPTNRRLARETLDELGVSL